MNRPGIVCRRLQHLRCWSLSHSWDDAVDMPAVRLCSSIPECSIDPPGESRCVRVTRIGPLWKLQHVATDNCERATARKAGKINAAAIIFLP